MHLLISAQQPGLDSPVEKRFGRAPWLIKIESDSQLWEALENPGVNQSGGAGVAAAQFAIDHNIDAVISGDFGPNAARTFRAAKIPMFCFSQGIMTIQDAVEAYNQGTLNPFH